MQLINTTTNEVVTVEEFKNAHPNVSFPIVIDTETYGFYGYAPVFDVPTPVYDKYTQKVSIGTPKLTDKGIYEQTWDVMPLEGEELANAGLLKTQEEEQANKTRISQLWQAATDYEQKYISGSAISLVTLGVINNKPKAKAVQEWINLIWQVYYTRKAELANNDLDFSSVGPCPHSIPELMSE